MPDDISPPSTNVDTLDPPAQVVEDRVEDASTRAAREELRHSHISNKKPTLEANPSSARIEQEDEKTKLPPREIEQEDEKTKLPPREIEQEDEKTKLQPREDCAANPVAHKHGKDRHDLSSPEGLSPNLACESRVPSPKKRAHDEDDEHQDEEKLSSSETESDEGVKVDESVEESGRSEPRKKRARGETSPPADIHKRTYDTKVSSPKKKRTHDEVDEQQGDEKLSRSGTESDEGATVDKPDEASGQSEPQKKRARDETSPSADIHERTAATTTADTSETEPDPAGKGSQMPQSLASATASAASACSKLDSSSASPFSPVEVNKNIFGGGRSTSLQSPSASLGAAAPALSSTAAPLSPPKFSFDSKEMAPSPFATMNGANSAAGVFGSAFGGGSSPFGNALGGARISTFATPGQSTIIKSDKPARPFGAPESDAEDESDKDGENGDDARGSGGGELDKEDTTSAQESTPAIWDEEKKGKFKRIVVDDGEAGEATIVQVRARMYYLHKAPNADGKEEMAWKERGVGNLKVNVPEDAVEINPQTGAVDLNTFDPTVLNKSAKEKPKIVRLVMRQDSTLRVILNTVMLAGMDFQLKEGYKTWSVLFTAIEGECGKHVPVTMKMSAQHAGIFCDKIQMIKKRMKNVLA